MPVTTSSDLVESTADIVRGKNPRTGKTEYRVLVTLDDGAQHISHEAWATLEEAHAALCEHLRLLGVPEQYLKPHSVN